MSRYQASALVVLIFFMAAGLGEEVVFSSSIPNATPASQTLPTDPSQLHREILSNYDAGRYAEAARLVLEMKTRYPDRYSLLPYQLLYARCLYLAGDKTA